MQKKKKKIHQKMRKKERENYAYNGRENVKFILNG